MSSTAWRLLVVPSALAFRVDRWGASALHERAKEKPGTLAGENVLPRLTCSPPAR